MTTMQIVFGIVLLFLLVIIGLVIYAVKKHDKLQELEDARELKKETEKELANMPISDKRKFLLHPTKR